MAASYSELMAEGKRVYRSVLRAEQAQRTRAAVLDAAGRRFVAQGYTGTTMRDVAEAAGVSVQTVFGQGSKASLLLACVDRAVVGDDETTPLRAREGIVRLISAGDRDEKLRLLRETALRYVPQTGPMLRAFAAAASVDPEIAAAFEEYGRRRYQDCRALIESFGPWLRDGLDVDRATDVFWAVFDHASSDALIEGRGWTLEEYCDWLVDGVDRLLLR
jgi:AcrR family transcriptional regulator